MNIMLFTAPGMKEAVLDGTKTQSRRTRFRSWKKGELVYFKERFLGPVFGVGRLTEDTREDQLCNISYEDILAEGVRTMTFFDYLWHGRSLFVALWNSIPANRKPGRRFADNPKVCVFEWELLEDRSGRE